MRQAMGVELPIAASPASKKHQAGNGLEQDCAPQVDRAPLPAPRKF